MVWFCWCFWAVSACQLCFPSFYQVKWSIGVCLHFKQISLRHQAGQVIHSIHNNFHKTDSAFQFDNIPIKPNKQLQKFIFFVTCAVFSYIIRRKSVKQVKIKEEKGYFSLQEHYSSFDSLGVIYYKILLIAENEFKEYNWLYFTVQN